MNNSTHHVHIRKRIYKKLEPYPHKKIITRWFDYLVYVIALATPAIFLPQVLRLFETKDAAGLSGPTWILFALIAVIWMFYGIIHKEWPIIISNILMSGLYIAFVIGIILYR